MPALISAQPSLDVVHLSQGVQVGNQIVDVNSLWVRYVGMHRPISLMDEHNEPDEVAWKLFQRVDELDLEHDSFDAGLEINQYRRAVRWAIERVMWFHAMMLDHAAMPWHTPTGPGAIRARGAVASVNSSPRLQRNQLVESPGGLVLQG